MRRLADGVGAGHAEPRGLSANVRTFYRMLGEPVRFATAPAGPEFWWRQDYTAIRLTAAIRGCGWLAIAGGGLAAGVGLRHSCR